MKETKFKQTLVQTKDERRKTKESTRYCEERSDVAIQSGFKMTEVGMIPHDWEVFLLSDLCSKIFSGKNKEKHEIGNYLVYGSTGVLGYSNKFAYDKPAILIARVGANAGIINEVDGKYDVSDNTLIVYGISCCQHYIYEFLKFWNLNKLVFGSGQPLITGGQLKKIEIPLPPTIEEQQRIANALSDVDSLIANLEKLIDKKKNIKQGAMQQLLTGKKRLPGFGSDERTGSRPTDERRKECHSERSAKREVEESSGYKMTELGKIPTDWEVKTFGELFDILPNNTLSRAELNEDSGSFKNVHYGDVLVKFPEWIDCSKNTLPFINSGAKFNHTVLQNGDVIIADTAEDETVGKSTEIYNVGKMKIVSGLHTIPIRPKKKFASKWLGYFINSACWHDQILPFITGTKVSAISKTAIAETKFFYPAKIDEQTAIANVLSDMDAEISALETKLAKYRTLKTGMMQQLLTGKIRLV